MNADSKKVLRTVIDAVSALRDLVQDEYDDLSAKQQDGAKGEALQEQLETIENAIDTLESLT